MTRREFWGVTSLGVLPSTPRPISLEGRVLDLEKRVGTLMDEIAFLQKGGVDDYQPQGQEQWFGVSQQLHELDRRVAALEGKRTR